MDITTIARRSGRSALLGAAVLATSLAMIPSALASNTGHSTLSADQSSAAVAAANTIRHSPTGKCLDVSGGRTADGTGVITWTCVVLPNQRWELRQVDNTIDGRVYEVRPQHVSGKCLDIAGMSTADGARAIMWTCNGQWNQQFILKPDIGGNGNFRMVARHSGKSLEPAHAQDGAAIRQMSGSNPNQLWRTP